MINGEKKSDEGKANKNNVNLNGNVKGNGFYNNFDWAKETAPAQDKSPTTKYDVFWWKNKDNVELIKI